MKASFMDFRRKPGEIIKALDRGESVTVLYRGKPKAVMQPIGKGDAGMRIEDHPAFGMWADREDMKDPVQWVRNLRRRRHAL